MHRGGKKKKKETEKRQADKEEPDMKRRWLLHKQMFLHPGGKGAKSHTIL